ncbi:signal peptidase I [Paenibacillus sp. DMB5]|uniref:signal peptidase I n=1 Tax=Paenibacillus sp. DMB5 TaxID=1780103 RepID=UPI00076C9B7F|nr:signal peptidase I [Paenibacillus sp. DMB5]KUP21664.1 hypothetical protein AWJ19_14825 [Paenibacillus sp. DMB5]
MKVIRKSILMLFAALTLGACNNDESIIEVEIMGPSMEPTYQDGQTLKVDTKVYEENEIERNDIVYFSSREDLYYVKRVIGLPGEEIVVTEEQILIDGVPLEMPYELKNNPIVGEYVTGQAEYFVIGDNYSDSLDSRTTGPVPRELIKGKVVD